MASNNKKKIDSTRPRTQKTLTTRSRVLHETELLASNLIEQKSATMPNGTHKRGPIYKVIISISLLASIYKIFPQKCCKLNFISPLLGQL